MRKRMRRVIGISWRRNKRCSRRSAERSGHGARNVNVMLIVKQGSDSVERTSLRCGLKCIVALKRLRETRDKEMSELVDERARLSLVLYKFSDVTWSAR